MLDWEDVKPLIQRHLGELAIPVYVYTTYHRDVVAKEWSRRAAFPARPARHLRTTRRCRPVSKPEPRHSETAV